MSNYYAITKHPVTKKWEYAEWMDDYKVHHNYGVRFNNDNNDLFDSRDHEMPTAELRELGKKDQKRLQPLMDKVLGNLSKTLCDGIDSWVEKPKLDTLEKKVKVLEFLYLNDKQYPSSQDWKEDLVKLIYEIL